MRRRLLLLLTLFLVAVPPAASAATITYTSLAAFQAASTTTNIDFSGLAPDGDVIFYGAGSLVIGGVTFSSPQGSMFVVDAEELCCHFPGSLAPATLYDDDFTAGDAFLITLAPAVTAAGFDVSNTCAPGCGVPSGTITVTLSNGFTHTFASTGVSNFFGFTTDVPVTSITVSSQHPFEVPEGGKPHDNFTELTNFRYGTAVTPVPEPASLLLLGTGLAAAGLRRRFSSRR